MNKSDIIKKVAKETGKSREDVKLIFESCLSSCTESLKSGEEISLHNFGRFYLKDSTERTGLHPKTGLPIVIKARKFIKFKPFVRLDRTINPHLKKR